MVMASKPHPSSPPGEHSALGSIGELKSMSDRSIVTALNHSDGVACDGYGKLETVEQASAVPAEPELPTAALDDTKSDMSMAADSDVEEIRAELAEGEAEQMVSMEAAVSGGPESSPEPSSKKRKAADSPLDEEPADTRKSSSLSKRNRVDGDFQQASTSTGIPLDKSLLPPEIWQHIFTFAPPQTLGNLLRVNKLFRRYLTSSLSPTSSPLPQSLLHSKISCLAPGAIWRASRQLFWRKIPSPLKDMSEFHMWRLICLRSCEFCGRKEERGSAAEADPFHAGPGMDGITPVFPFAVVSCGTCLLQHTVKVWLYSSQLRRCQHWP